MTKEITKAFILGEIQDKFQLREFKPEPFTFSEKVIPTYDVEQHLLRRHVTFSTISITAGPQGFLFYQIPDDEKWVLRGYNIVFMAAGAYTVTGLYVRRGGAANIIYLDMTAGQTVSYAINLPNPIALEPHDFIYIYVDGYTSTADLRLYIDYTKETIR